MRLPDPPVLLITDRARALRPLDEVVSAALAAGCRWISLREKDMDPADRLALARRLAELAGGYGATVTVHGDLEAAGAVGGIHLPAGASVAQARRRLGPKALIGVSSHDPAELESAARDGAHYATLSPVFASLSKPGYGPGPGLQGLRQAASAGTLPVIALGGIEPEKVPQCLEAGAHGIAVMGAVMASADPGGIARRLVDYFA